MKEYHPQSDYLKLISLGGKKALAEKRGLAVSGTMMWRWKDQIDRKFMRQFDDLKPMAALELPSEHAQRVRSPSRSDLRGMWLKGGARRACSGV